MGACCNNTAGGQDSECMLPQSGKPNGQTLQGSAGGT